MQNENDLEALSCIPRVLLLMQNENDLETLSCVPHVSASIIIITPLVPYVAHRKNNQQQTFQQPLRQTPLPTPHEKQTEGDPAGVDDEAHGGCRGQGCGTADCDSLGGIELSDSGGGGRKGWRRGAKNHGGGTRRRERDSLRPGADACCFLSRFGRHFLGGVGGRRLEGGGRGHDIHNWVFRRVIPANTAGKGYFPAS